jgi:hypothetical protein
MHDRRDEIEGRLARALEERIRPAVHRVLAPLTVEAWHVPPAADGKVGEPVSFAEARRASYEPAAVGLRWGPAWGTTWLRLIGEVPADSLRPEAVVDLGFTPAHPGFQAEGLVYDAAGRTVKALNPRSTWLPAEPGQRIEWYVEAAANPTVLHRWQPRAVDPLVRVAGGRWNGVRRGAQARRGLLGRRRRTSLRAARGPDRTLGDPDLPDLGGRGRRPPRAPAR